MERFNIQTSILVLVWKEQLFQIGIGNVIIERPANPKSICSFKYCLAGFAGCDLIAFHFALAAPHTSKHKNFPVVRHFDGPP